MYFKQIYEKGLAQASYIIGCQASGTAIVVDPKRDIDTYFEIAEAENLNITHVTETHIHADFLSGSRELVAKTGAQLLLSEEGGSDWQYQFDKRGLKDGDIIMVGNIRLAVMHTPGHTPEHISFLVTDTPAGDHPSILLSGDFVFVGDIGRPDLLEKAAGLSGTMQLGARQMYNSLKKFSALPDFVQVWPGHGAGSACGKALGSVPASTVGYEKLVNWAFQIEDEELFVKTLLEGQPEPPKYFAMMKKLNKIKRPLLPDLPEYQPLTVPDLKKAQAENTIIVDVRDKSEFSQAHIPGSLHIEADSAFSMWAGWLLDYESRILLVADQSQINEITRALMRIGLDNVLGAFSFNEWRKAGEEIASVKNITAWELNESLAKGQAQVIDVRGYLEYESGRIAQAKNIHLGYLSDQLNNLPRDTHLVLQCQSGGRSTMAYSLLAKNKFKNIANLTGGLADWVKQGFETAI